MSTKIQSEFFKEINNKSDKIMNFVIVGYFVVGIFLATFYDTYLLALGVGGLCLVAYFSTKLLLPNYRLYQYVLSVIFGVFSAQYIYQMHGLFEMHFFFIVGAALLITYQNWKLQLPLLTFILLHHTSFAYLQYSGMKEIYFTQLDYMDLQTLLFHAGTVGIIVFICGYWSYDLAKKTNREEETVKQLREKLNNINNNIAFANEISQGNLEVQYERREGDSLGEALLTMKENLLRASTREQKEKFITGGVAAIGEILRKHAGDMQQMSDELIRSIVKYLGANQGGLFLLEADDQEQYLKLTSCYAYDRKKFLDRQVAIGEGLVGQCFVERDIIYLTDVPHEYVRITSGLGTANPNAIILVPLISNEDIVGVVELASFEKFTDEKIEFLKKVSEAIASAVISTGTTEKIKLLLGESQQRSEELRAQEEEMRQNMEELNAVQEQMTRQLTEMENVKSQLEVRDRVFGITTILSESDVHGTITFANEKLSQVSGYSNDEMIGQSHNLFRHSDMPKELFKLMWSTIKEGKVFRGIVKNRAKNGTHYWVDAAIVPIKDKSGKIVKYVGARYHITNDALAESLYHQQMQRLFSSEMVHQY